ncbi:MAG: hypothetical protein AAGM16_10275 [Pseudomonadota bacterium]
MSETPESSLQRFARMSREFFVIVIGVFVALAAESWWSEREDRQLERELRTDMIAEFAANISILEADIAANIDYMGRTRGLVEDEGDPIGTLPDAELLRRIDRSYEWAGFDPEMGAALALVDGGNINTIADRSLRLRMTRWSGQLIADKRYTLQTVAFGLQTLIPWIATAGNDGVVTAEEREMLRYLLSTNVFLQQIILDSQKRLLETARDVHAYLESTQ